MRISQSFSRHFKRKHFGVYELLNIYLLCLHFLFPLKKNTINKRTNRSINSAQRWGQRSKSIFRQNWKLESNKFCLSAQRNLNNIPQTRRLCIKLVSWMNVFEICLLFPNALDSFWLILINEFILFKKPTL